jgi:hypothetical protein
MSLWNQGGGGPKKFGDHWSRASSLFAVTVVHAVLQYLTKSELWCVCGGNPMLLLTSRDMVERDRCNCELGI